MPNILNSLRARMQRLDYASLVARGTAGYKEGKTYEELLATAKKDGFPENLASTALLQAMHDAPVGQLPTPWTSAAHIASLARKYPGLRLRLAADTPRIAVVDNLLTERECDELIVLSAPQFAPLPAIKGEGAGQRVCVDMVYELGANPLVERLETRIAEVFNWPHTHAEGFIVSKYTAGGEFKPHFDYHHPHTARGKERLAGPGGQRVGTLVLYLNTPSAGGHTTFAHGGIHVVPQKGSALFFSYDRASPCSNSLHAGLPVVQGEKCIANKMFLEKAGFSPAAQVQRDAPQAGHSEMV